MTPPDCDHASIAGFWPIGAVRRAWEVASGAVNRIIEIDAEAGRFFLRSYRHGSVALIGREHRIIAHVRQAGLPAVAPLRATNGATFVELGGRFHALYPAADGGQREEASLAEEEAAAAGSMLGRLHRVLKDVAQDGLPAPRIGWDGASWVERLRKVETAILALDNRCEADVYALQRVRDQAAWLSEPDCPHDDEPADRQPIHGDYHQSNLFFGKGGVTGIIDWEQTALMPRAYEAVRAATYMFDLSPHLSAVFLRAWKEAARASDEEIAAGARTFGVVRDHWVWAVEEVYLAGNDRARRYIPGSPFQPFAQRWVRFLAEIDGL